MGTSFLPSVPIRDNRLHVIDIRSLPSLLWTHCPPCIPVLPVMKLLRFEHPLHLVRHRVVRVVTKIRGYLVRTGEYRRARPARYVDGFLVDRLLCHLYWINSTHYSTKSVPHDPRAYYAIGLSTHSYVPVFPLMLLP